MSYFYVAHKQGAELKVSKGLPAVTFRRSAMLAVARNFLVVAVLAALLPGPVLAQVGPSWAQVDEDESFADAHAEVPVPATRNSEAGVLQVGCDPGDGLPRVVLRAERDLGVGERVIYLRVVGLQDATMHEVTLDGTNLVVNGFGAVAFLAEVLAFRSARAMFLQLEGDDEAAWSVPLRGMRDALVGVSCFESLGITNSRE